MAVILRQNGTTRAHTHARTLYCQVLLQAVPRLSMQHSLGSSIIVKNAPLSMESNRAAHKVERFEF